MPEFQYTPFEPYHKTPFGPVPQGEPVRFRVQVKREQAAFSVCLALARDGEAAEPLPMGWLGLEDGWDEYERTVEGLGPGLYWYWFQQDVFGDVSVHGKDAPWQLTVYGAGYRTPDWFDAGVTYHIFVDRFHRVGEPPAPKACRPFRWHANWDDAPDIYPQGESEQNYDFFGGNLPGIEEKLGYLESLGVTTIYLSPVFEAASNHRYDTGDYTRIDPIAGDEEDFARLCEKAKTRGMRVILDGVFSHTGSDSRYFNAKGFYDSVGAAQSQDSPYAGWYSFQHWPDEYACWWGVKTLPQVNELDASYIRYTLFGQESIVRRWLAAGAAGWRLDVADELPREYLEQLRLAVKAEKEDAVIIGEVWDDASNKTSYGERRRYFQGRELDGVTNYPARDAILAFAGGDRSAADTAHALMALQEHYPAPARRCMMNILGTHDTPRALTTLGCGHEAWALSKGDKAAYVMDDEELRRGKARLKLASAIQYMLPGSPCLYYGDEAGLAGFEDPLNRRCYPWGHEDGELLAWFRALGAMRRDFAWVFQGGSFAVESVGLDVLRVTRCVRSEKAIATINRGDSSVRIEMPRGTLKG